MDVVLYFGVHVNPDTKELVKPVDIEFTLVTAGYPLPDDFSENNFYIATVPRRNKPTAFIFAEADDLSKI